MTTVTLHEVSKGTFRVQNYYVIRDQMADAAGIIVLHFTTNHPHCGGGW